MIPVRAYWRLLVDYLRPQRARVAVLGVLLLGGIALQLASPQLIRAFLDRATAGEPSGRLVPLAIWFMVLAVAHQVLGVLSTYLAEDVGWTATNRMRDRLAAHVVGLDMGFHKEHTPGELIERVDGDVTSLSNFFSAFAIKVVGNLVLVTGVVVLLWLENGWVGLAMTIFTLVALTGMVAIQQVAVPWWKQMRARSAEFFGFVGEQVSGTEDIRASGATGYMLHRFTHILRAWLPETVRARLGFAALWGSNILAYAVGTTMVFLLGSLLFGRSALTIGSVYLIFHYVEMTRHPMDQIRAQLEDFQKAGAGISRVEDLFARTPVLPPGGTTVLPAGALAVDFDHVEFTYDDNGDPEGNGHVPARVLHDVDFALDPGRVLGLLGRSGSGKTTIARLLTRLYDPQSGEVRLGGTPLPDVATESLRTSVGMVTQDVQLFRATVRDNLTFFDPAVSDERILAVLEELGLDEWLDGLAAGLDSMLESGGGGLSAGQAQLLAFARIFLADPGLVILDEASSRLDPATEALIERAVDKLLADRTAVIIAHRLATVTRADDILIMEDGSIVEHGARVALAADPASRFSRLLATGMEELLV
jgi:ATP-binding cassette, subfamily B, bacterial